MIDTDADRSARGVFLAGSSAAALARPTVSLDGFHPERSPFPRLVKLFLGYWGCLRIHSCRLDGFLCGSLKPLIAFFFKARSALNPIRASAQKLAHRNDSVCSVIRDNIFLAVFACNSAQNSLPGPLGYSPRVLEAETGGNFFNGIVCLPIRLTDWRERLRNGDANKWIGCYSHADTCFDLASRR